MLQDVTAKDGVKLATKLGKIIERHSPKAMTILRIKISRDFQKCLGDIDTEIIQLKSMIPDELEHHTGATTYIEHRRHITQQAQRGLP